MAEEPVFEVDGANAARAFPQGARYRDPAAATCPGMRSPLHTTRSIALHKESPKSPMTHSGIAVERYRGWSRSEFRRIKLTGDSRGVSLAWALKEPVFPVIPMQHRSPQTGDQL